MIIASAGEFLHSTQNLSRKITAHTNAAITHAHGQATNVYISHDRELYKNGNHEICGEADLSRHHGGPYGNSSPYTYRLVFVVALTTQYCVKKMNKATSSFLTKINLVFFPVLRKNKIISVVNRPGSLHFIA